MSEPINLNPAGPPNTVLPGLELSLAQRLAGVSDTAGFAAIVADYPTCLDAWAALGEGTESGGTSTADTVEAYAYYRIGYHRGLDALRKNGWRGSGYVRWAEPTNRGFLRCLDGLRRMAHKINETEEQARCAEFLRQLDPAWPPEGR